MRQHLTRLLSYNNWANTTLIANLAASESVPERANALMGHLILSQQAWFERVELQPQSLPFWKKLSYEEMSQLATSSGNSWLEFVSVVPQHQFRATVGYKNSKGESYDNTILDVITHVVNHASHHRAQIVQLLRHAGIEPPVLDYIVYARSIVPTLT